ALIICNPSCDAASVRTREILQKERIIISKVLFNHCIKSHGKALGPNRFVEILALEGILMHQAQRTKQLQALMTVLNLRSINPKLMDETCGLSCA
ncbi:hypothetical protein PENTCL1PPCAC_30403, partial [Pristionchus entomophagus]